jgi:chaperonin cofactor prefoldin
METTINKRVNDLINLYCHGKQREFAEATKIPEATVSGIVGKGLRKTDAKSETLRTILNTFTNVNPVWLLIGTPPMLLSDIKAEDTASLKEEISRLKKEIATLNNRIAKLEEESELRLSLIRAYELQIQGLKDNIKELKKIG